VGALLVIRIIREAVNYNEYFRLSQKPFVVGVAGDSGSGKDTLVNSIRDLFGSPSTTVIHGDDYHIWDRHKPIWRLLTHLNPSANDLEGLAKDLISLINGKRINLRHYDHSTGIKSNHVTIESKEFIFVNSLHALYLPIYREIYDLSIYLDMDEKLRQSLKIRRDVHERGHDLDAVMQSIARRREDKNKFIYPQRQHADLILALHPVNIQALDGKIDLDKIAYKLDLVSRSDQLRKSLLRVLVGICGLHIETHSTEGSDFYNFTIEGDSKAEDMMLAAKFLCPRSSEFFDINPVWKDGMLGVMQLIVLTHIEQILEKRFI
jgi:uridine kinase